MLKKIKRQTVFECFSHCFDSWSRQPDPSVVHWTFHSAWTDIQRWIPNRIRALFPDGVRWNSGCSNWSLEGIVENHRWIPRWNSVSHCYVLRRVIASTCRQSVLERDRRRSISRASKRSITNRWLLLVEGRCKHYGSQVMMECGLDLPLLCLPENSGSQQLAGINSFATYKNVAARRARCFFRSNGFVIFDISIDCIFFTIDNYKRSNGISPWTREDKPLWCLTCSGE